MHILYLVPHVPNPTKLRSWSQIRGLHEAGHKVTIVTVARSPKDARQIEYLEQSGFRVIHGKLTKIHTTWNSLLRLPTRLPLQSAFMWSKELMAKITRHVATDPPDVVHVEHLRMACYGLQLARQWPTVWDAVDYLAWLYEQAAGIAANRVLRWIARVEQSRLASYERWLCGQFPLTLMISGRDLDYFREKNPYADRLRVLSQGLAIHPLTWEKARSCNTLVISGTLDYHPNIASVYRFVHDIFPLIANQYPDVCLQLVGANPVSGIRALKARNIEITGYVPSLIEYLEHATIALAPVLYGSGIQVKVLEAFLTATPVVATTMALRGLDVRHGEQVLVADHPAEFADRVLQLLNDPDLRIRLGNAGRRYVEEHHDLRVTTEALVAVYKNLIDTRHQCVNGLNH